MYGVQTLFSVRLGAIEGFEKWYLNIYIEKNNYGSPEKGEGVVEDKEGVS